MSSHIRLNCTSHLTPVMTLITDESTSYSEVWKLNFTVHLWSFQVSNSFLHKYQPSSGQTLSLLMKTCHLRLKLVELNFFASFTTDDQSNFNVSNTFKSSRWTFSIKVEKGKNVFLYQNQLILKIWESFKIFYFLGSTGIIQLPLHSHLKVPCDHFYTFIFFWIG